MCVRTLGEVYVSVCTGIRGSVCVCGCKGKCIYCMERPSSTSPDAGCFLSPASSHRLSSCLQYLPFTARHSSMKPLFIELLGAWSHPLVLNEACRFGRNKRLAGIKGIKWGRLKARAGLCDKVSVNLCTMMSSP